MRCTLVLISSIILFSTILKSQDCINYHLKSCKRLDPNPYGIVPEGCKSALLHSGEQMEVTFHIVQGKDYRVSMCSEEFGKNVVLRIYDSEKPSLVLYDNTKNDSAQVFEFQVFTSRQVRAVVSIPEEKNQPSSTAGILIVKTPRGCVGLLLESMITRK